jgi:hypothetical protein
VHGVSLRAFRTVLAGLLVVGAVTACGPDLGKANFARTTVAAQPGSGEQAPDGPITDPAVTPAVLRLVDPCGLVDNATLADLGTPAGPRASGIDLGMCFNDVKDAGGKTIKISVQLGSSTIGGADKASGAVGGLPRIEDKADDGSCDVTALTGKAPDLGIRVNTVYTGGDSCRTAGGVLEKVVKRIHENPPKYTVEKGSLIDVDLCTVLDEQVAAEVVPAARKQAGGLHVCSWLGSGPNLLLTFNRGAKTTESADYQPVDLGGGVTGFQKTKKTGPSDCSIRWQHRSTNGDVGENLALSYSYYSADVSKDDPCGKALKLVKNVITKVPKP